MILYEENHGDNFIRFSAWRFRCDGNDGFFRAKNARYYHECGNGGNRLRTKRQSTFPYRLFAVSRIDEPCGCNRLTLGALLVQGVATSIDALSAGLDFAAYDLGGALVAALVIAVVTFFICVGGIFLGKKFGTKLAGKASILGGAILIFIGLEIFIKSWF